MKGMEIEQCGRPEGGIYENAELSALNKVFRTAETRVMSNRCQALGFIHSTGNMNSKQRTLSPSPLPSTPHNHISRQKDQELKVDLLPWVTVSYHYQ